MTGIETKLSPGEYVLASPEIRNVVQAIADELLRRRDRIAEELGRLFLPPRRPERLVRMRSAYRRRKGGRW